ncbi:DsrH/TusB family sulfur metabolism protein [Crenothrix polyspora]|uniref:Sulfur relay protein TusB/DsrH n=1 Tax=Crenothrix polyspora TaxID=360316 RepID=A0A1R4H597_9GAMM|nr:DsrH/TusB family sulfur metabolism protein [Crenothrix polyspora]SJM91438.1 Sulfur relay protein TusB/DsrH [Crenothrix polyspora]
MLHFIFQLPIDSATLARIDADDVVVFFESALFKLLKTGVFSELLTEKLKTNRLCVVADELVVRGIAADTLLCGLDIIDYTELVNLSVSNTLIQSWT